MNYTLRLAGLRLKARGTDWYTHLTWLLRVEQQQHIKDTVK
jgi:hypothetical protein